MSNEEILKRFEFDLEMGLFKFTINTNVNEGGYYIFRAKDNRKLVKVLITLEYKGGFPIYWDSPIAIYKESRNYVIMSPYGIFARHFNDTVNEIPDYIDEFDEKEYYKCMIDKVMKE